MTDTPAPIPGLEALFGGAPVGLTGPGTQPAEADGATLDYMIMPDEMRVFSSANAPETAEATPQGLAAAEAILAALCRVEKGADPESVDLSHLDAANLAFIDELLGEGEVSVIAGPDTQAQESVLAGVWRLRTTTAQGRLERVDIAPFPLGVVAQAFGATPQRAAQMPTTAPADVFNAPPLIAEINEAIASRPTSAAPHVVNLSLLPHTEGDLAFLEAALGRGDTILLSRGYGNCRIRSTATQNVWWVQYFNSQDTLILNSIEVSPLPAVAMAAPEDIADSAERLSEILAIYR